MYTWVNKALVVRAGVVSRRVGVYCMYWGLRLSETEHKILEENRIKTASKPACVFVEFS